MLARKDQYSYSGRVIVKKASGTYQDLYQDEYEMKLGSQLS